MPPSGFRQKAINGLLEFVRVNYEATLTQYASQQSELSESDFLQQSSTALEQRVNLIITQSPLGVDETGVAGLMIFLISCYEDLVHEIYQGNDKYGRPVVDGEAIQKELDQIKSYLTEFKI